MPCEVHSPSEHAQMLTKMLRSAVTVARCSSGPPVAALTRAVIMAKRQASRLQNLFDDPSLPSPSELPTEFVGDWGTYRVSGDRLGAGCFGLVVRGEKLATGEDVAIKCCLGKDQNRKWWAELQILQNLCSRYVVKVWDHHFLENRLMLLVFEKASRSLLDEAKYMIGVSGVVPERFCSPRQ